MSYRNLSGMGMPECWLNKVFRSTGVLTFLREIAARFFFLSLSLSLEREKERGERRERERERERERRDNYSLSYIRLNR